MFSGSLALNRDTRTDWQIYAEVMGDVRDFLKSNLFIPQKLFIQQDGWVEAHFDAVETESRSDDWYVLEESGQIHLDRSSLLPESLYDSVVKLRFRLTTHLSRWERIRQRLS